MKAYLDLIEDILDNGWVHDNRTGIDTKRVWVRTIRHNLQGGFPLLTTKRMAVKASFVEMLGFIRGETDVRWYQDRGCKIWNANYDDWHGNQLSKDREKLKSCSDSSEYQRLSESIEYRENNPHSLGLIYGYQWRNMNGFDQLNYILQELRRKSNSRRLIMSGWNPSEFHLMCLPPCHIMYHFSVRGEYLDVAMTQRSCDSGLGVPFNLANTALLCHILAHCSGLYPGEMVWTGHDVHIYKNHEEQLREQISRELYELPILLIKDKKDPWDIEYDDISVVGYKHHPPIKMEMAV